MFALLLVAVAPLGPAPAECDHRARLLDAATSAWRKNRETYANYRMKVRTTFPPAQKNGITYTEVEITEYWFGGRSDEEVRLTYFQSNPDPAPERPRQRAEVRNQDYAFTVRRRNPGSPWQLTRPPVRSTPANGSDLPLISFRRMDHLTFFSSDAVEVTDFKVDPGGTEASVSFIIRKKLPLLDVGDKGDFRFDIPAGWLLKAYTHEADDFRFSAEYFWRVEGGVARLTKAIRRDSRAGKVRPEIVEQYEEFALEPPPPEMVRLAYYGIDESIATTFLTETSSAGTSRITLWLVGGALTLAVLARLFGRGGGRSAH